MAKKITIKAIIFDLGGVVVHGGYMDFIKHYCKECLTTLGKKRLARLERQGNLGEITENEFYRQIQKIFGVKANPGKMHELIVSKMKTDRGLAHLIPHLKKAKVAMFTNSIGHMAQDVLDRRRLNHHKFFEKVFDSSDLHIAKPDATAYRFVLHKLGVKPHQAIMVDDRPLNIRGAKRVGMHGIVYKNSRQFKTALKKYELV